MENLKIRVTTEQESKEAQELFFKLGYYWAYKNLGKKLLLSEKDVYLFAESNGILGTGVKENESFFNDWRGKEITLQELRDMVKPKVKEYLFKYNDQYTLVELSKEDAESNPDQYIEVPIGADIAVYPHFSKGISFFKNNFRFAYSDSSGEWKETDYCPENLKHWNSWRVAWQRETLNDKIASAEVARQQSKNIDATLAERQSQYGSFTGVANTTGQLMAIIKNSPNGHTMPYAHEEALHMICSKIARIVNGDINHLDSWHDIGGYSKLIEDLIGDVNEI